MSHSKVFSLNKTEVTQSHELNVKNMMLECYEICDDGEDKQIESKDLKLTHKTAAIIASHANRTIYIFKGSKISIVQKFSSARLANILRLQKGYVTKHVEETEGIDNDFIPIYDFLGGIIEEEEPQMKIEPKKESSKQTIKSFEKKPITTPKTTPAKPKAEEVISATTQKSTKKPTSKIQTQETKAEDISGKLTKVHKAMTSLEPPPSPSCDYLLVGTSLYILTGDDRTDLRNAKFNFEEVTTLPEGVFSAENYFPRILIDNKKILGVELWKRK